MRHVAMMQRLVLLFALTTAARAATAGILDDLHLLGRGKTARVSSYDRSGGNADARPIGPGETLVLAEIKGPAIIRHIWVTIASDEPAFLRRLALRMFWDGEQNPSVEAPIGDFFGVGHGIAREFYSLPLTMTTDRGFNCYFPMPFNRSARITVTNDGAQRVGAFYYHIDYEKLDRPLKDAAYFHARWHRENPTTATDGKPNLDGAENYVILEAQGRGHYVGCNYSVHQLSPGWWGEGDDMIFIDGEKTPSIVGTGSEDYFNAAWGFARKYWGPFHGCTVVNEEGALAAKTCVYRYHLLDPIRFERSIKVTIEHGHANDRSDDISSVAYWYQTEPHVNWSPLPPVEQRLPRDAPRPPKVEGAIEGEDLLSKSAGIGGGLSVQELGGGFGPWSGGKHLFFTPARKGASLTIDVFVERAGTYEIIGRFTRAPDYGTFILQVDGRTVGQPFDGYHHAIEAAPPVSFGEVFLSAERHPFRVVITGKNDRSSGHYVGIDYFLLKPK